MTVESDSFQLANRPDNFTAGKIYQHRHKWRSLTSDPFLLALVQGNFLEFIDEPVHSNSPFATRLSHSDSLALDSAVDEFLAQGIIELCNPIQDSGFYSTIFPRIKKDGSARIILNLKSFNEHIHNVHFKMDTIREVLFLVQPGYYFASIDLKHAYFSVRAAPSIRRFFRFIWAGHCYQFTCLPQGLASAPRLFTKLTKPVLAHLRARGLNIICYIDDCILMSPSLDQLKNDVAYAAAFFDSLGLTIHIAKSNLCPTTTIEFLGFLIDSISMTVTLTQGKKTKIQGLAQDILRKTSISIQTLAQFIGNVVAADIAVPHAPLYYKLLEIERNDALTQHGGDYLASITLSSDSLSLIQWWLDNIDSQSSPIQIKDPDFEIFSDASLMGWGGSFEDLTTGGHWARRELAHINILELRAALFTLQSLCSECHDCHICLRMDNTTAVACVNKVGSTKPHLFSVVQELFSWALDRNIALSAVHIPGVDNVVADQASRISNMDTEWMLNPKLFHKLCLIFDTPEVDAFATRLNRQLPTFFSWKPDPEAVRYDAFSSSWSDSYMYCFPPFSVLSRVLQKIQQQEATVLLVFPLWPTRPWFPRVLDLMIAPPVLLPKHCLWLPQNPESAHPLALKLIMAAAKLSGKHSLSNKFQMTLPHSCYTPGELAPCNNIGVISADGCDFVLHNRTIHFFHL